MRSDVWALLGQLTPVSPSQSPPVFQDLWPGGLMTAEARLDWRCSSCIELLKFIHSFFNQSLEIILKELVSWLGFAHFPPRVAWNTWTDNNTDNPLEVILNKKTVAVRY